METWWDRKRIMWFLLVQTILWCNKKILRVNSVSTSILKKIWVLQIRKFPTKCSRWTTSLIHWRLTDLLISNPNQPRMASPSTQWPSTLSQAASILTVILTLQKFTFVLERRILRLSKSPLVRITHLMYCHRARQKLMCSTPRALTTKRTTSEDRWLVRVGRSVNEEVTIDWAQHHQYHD